MTEDWEYRFQKEIIDQIDTLREYVITSPSNDPRILDTLDQIKEETDLIKVHELLVSLVPIVAEDLEFGEFTEEQIKFCRTVRYSENIDRLEKRKDGETR